MALIDGYQETHIYNSGRFSNITFQDTYQIERPEPRGVLQRLGLKNPQRRFDSLCDNVLSGLAVPFEGVAVQQTGQPIDSSRTAVDVKITKDEKGRNKAVKVQVYHVVDLSDGDYKGYHKTLREHVSDPAKKEKLESAKRKFLAKSRSLNACIREETSTRGINVEPEKTIKYWDFWKMVD